VSIQVLAHADHDDALFARLAISLLGSEWLSGYDFLTPVKEPVYPMWLAAVSSGPSAAVGSSMMRTSALKWTARAIAMAWR